MANLSVRTRVTLLVFTLIMGIGGLAGGGIYYTNGVEQRTRAELIRLQEESQRDLCEMMLIFDDPLAPPPATERGRVQLDAIRRYLDRRCR